jgi:hypothetical protein
MSLTYSTWITQFANLLVYDPTDAAFLTMSQSAIDYAEQRLYRELDLLATRVTDATTSFAVNNRNFTLPTTTGTFLVVERINAISPAGTPAASGSRKPLTMVSPDWIDVIYPASTVSTGTPAYCAMVSNTAMIVGPSPDGAYVAEVIGTQRPTPLSSIQTTSILTTMLPDLWMAATMIFGTSFQRDFGASTDTPQASQSWEGQFQALLKSAGVEEVRKKYQGQGWTSTLPSPIATPPRA